MPYEYSMGSLPKPNNSRVRLKEIPAKEFIAIEFSGRNLNKNLTKYEKQLMKYIEPNPIKTIGSPKYAFYDPLWTLPFMRLNKVMVEIRQQQ